MLETTKLTKVVTHSSGRSKTVCTAAVLSALGILPGEYHYSSCRTDIERILRRNGYSVRSRMSKVGRCTIGQARQKISKLKEPGYYYVSVPGHAMLLDHHGNTIVDTDPRKRDRRRVLGITKVTRMK